MSTDVKKVPRFYHKRNLTSKYASEEKEKKKN